MSISDLLEEERDKYKEIIDNIRLNLQGCDTEHNIWTTYNIQQMAFMLTVIHNLVKE